MHRVRLLIARDAWRCFYAINPLIRRNVTIKCEGHRPVASLHFVRKLCTNLTTTELQYENGIYKLPIPIETSPNVEGKRVFTLFPETTMTELIKRIQAEDPSIHSVDVRTQCGEAISKEQILQRVATMDFQLILNEQVIPVKATGNKRGLASRPEVAAPQIDLKSFARISSIIAFRGALENASQWKISLREYFQLGMDHGISKKEATALLTHFQQTGVVLYYGTPSVEDSSGHSIFLQPKIVMDAYYKSVGLTPVSTQQFHQKREEILQQIAILEPQQATCAQLYLQLKNSAKRYSSCFSYLITGTLVSGFGLYFWLSFFHFSWDIMEPVTYFTGFGVSIIGYTWWSITNQEYEYANVYDYIYRRKLDKLIQRAKFNLPQFQDTTEKVRFLKDRVDEMDAVLAKPVQLQAKYLHVLRDEAEFTKVRGDPYYVSTVLDGIASDLNAKQTHNKQRSKLD
uniref:Transmembrane protein putative n=1 Tax=Albugo laibachii Nc14 TaxID=890382 RepID=F0WC49_9STRA|nr:transmembrane protein putative [Albugo laibachii Nc14]CCA25202.1 transmembrane protein putative [Albugo laibachii Nc14]|eukprot:CCA25202.1 transmembrane protein putative [Albugo laibachii Nc14]